MRSGEQPAGFTICATKIQSVPDRVGDFAVLWWSGKVAFIDFLVAASPRPQAPADRGQGTGSQVVQARLAHDQMAGG